MKSRHAGTGFRSLSVFLSLCLVFSFSFTIGSPQVAGAEEAPVAPAGAVELVSIPSTDHAALLKTLASLAADDTVGGKLAERLMKSADAGVASRFFTAYEALSALDGAGNSAEDVVEDAAIGTAFSWDASAAAEGERVVEGATFEPLDLSLQATQWKRLSGDVRYDTMRAIVQEAYPSTVPSDCAILASGANFPDALAASGLAGLLDAPIILTTPNTLSSQARDEILRLGVDMVIIVGGTPAVSAQVERQVAALACVEDVDRLSGPDRYATAYEIYAAAISDDYYPWSDAAFIVTGNNFADALSIAPLAFASGSPIFLYDTANKTFDPQTRAALTSGKFEGIFLIGGPPVLPDSLLTSLGDIESVRISGDDRYLTSGAVADFGLLSDLFSVDGLTATAGLATGLNYPDALCGAPLCGRLGAPLYLAYDSPTGRVGIYRSLARSYYADALTQAYIFGGPPAVSSELESKVKSLGVPTSPEQQVVDLVNIERNKAGLQPLQVDPILQGVADIRADELTKLFDRNHMRPNGSVCFTAYSEDLQGSAYRWVGENIAMGSGYSTPAAVMQGWMNSSSHKSNILDPDFTHIGVGFVEGSPFWVQFFGG
jgi:uncharacterized protein YkwD